MKGWEAEAGEEIKQQRRSDRARAAPVGKWGAQVAHHSYPALGCSAGPFHLSSLSSPSGGGPAAEGALREFNSSPPGLIKSPRIFKKEQIPSQLTRTTESESQGIEPMFLKTPQVFLI